MTLEDAIREQTNFPEVRAAQQMEEDLTLYNPGANGQWVYAEYAVEVQP